jgi:dephospho-CoA kinase
MIIGVTGGSGAGKSTVCRYLEENYHASIIDIDRIGHKVLEPGGLAYADIVAKFGPDFLNTDWTVNCKKLGEYVFKNPEELEVLNSVTHPHIIALTKECIRCDESEIIVIDAALLFEADMGHMCDVVIGVIAEEELRVKRIMERDKISESAAIQRIYAQDNIMLHKDSIDYFIETGAPTALPYIIDDIMIQILE